MIFAGKSQDEEDRLVAASRGRRDKAGVLDCRRQHEVGALPQNRPLATAFLLRGIKMVDEIGSSLLAMVRSWSARSASSKPFAKSLQLARLNSIRPCTTQPRVSLPAKKNEKAPAKH
jgi:hypothetical protein